MNISVAHDDNGNEVFPVEIKTIAPIEFADKAKKISCEFMKSIGGEDCEESMLPIFLGLIGTGVPTHVYCVRNSYTHELKNQLDFLKLQKSKLISGELETDPSRILTLFCTFDNDLQSLGLEVV